MGTVWPSHWSSTWQSELSLQSVAQGGSIAPLRVNISSRPHTSNLTPYISPRQQSTTAKGYCRWLSWVTITNNYTIHLLTELGSLNNILLAKLSFYEIKYLQELLNSTLYWQGGRLKWVTLLWHGSTTSNGNTGSSTQSSLLGSFIIIKRHSSIWNQIFLWQVRELYSLTWQTNNILFLRVTFLVEIFHCTYFLFFKAPIVNIFKNVFYY